MYNLNEMLNECIEQCTAVGIKLYDIESVNVNSRLKRPWARCVKRTPRYGNVTCKIEFAPKTMTSTNTEEVKSTMMHEVLHCAVGAKGHGAKWKMYASTVNRTYGYNVKTTGSYEDFGVDKEEYEKAKYELYCPKCGCVWKYKSFCKAIRNPGRYTHNGCGVALKSRGINGNELWSTGA